MDQVSHDATRDLLRNSHVTTHDPYQLVRLLLTDSPDCYLIIDDSVQDKRYSRKIELVKRQYSGNEHGLVRGIDLVNLVHSDGTCYYPIDFRIYSMRLMVKPKMTISKIWLWQCRPKSYKPKHCCLKVGMPVWRT